MRRRVALFILVGSLVSMYSAPPVGAIDQGQGHPGFCRTATGVTVVIDFGELGGPTIVRCNPRSTRGTGLDAIKGAGIQITGVQRWGEAFICRIENRPSATETIPVIGNTGYREQCIDTPPAAAYWSYWHAGNNCAWTYSQWGVKNRDFIPGGFEGWSFSLNATADSNPIPRIAPVRPGTEGGRCTTRTEPGPSTNDPDEQLTPIRPATSSATGSPTSPAPAPRPDGSGAPGSAGATGSAGTAGATTNGAGSDPTDRTGSTVPGRAGSDPDVDPAHTGPARSAGSAGTTGAGPGQGTGQVAAGSARGRPGVDPSANVDFTGGADAPDVRDVLRREAGANRFAPWFAIAGMIGLAGAAGWVEGRRRRQRAN